MGYTSHVWMQRRGQPDRPLPPDRLQHWHGDQLNGVTDGRVWTDEVTVEYNVHLINQGAALIWKDYSLSYLNMTQQAAMQKPIEYAKF